MIYFENELEHQKHVHKVLQWLYKTGLQTNIKKLEFSVKCTKYLGFIISTDEIKTNPEKMATINQWTPPQIVKGVQSFLGFYNFYQHFIKNYSKVAQPLNCFT